MRHEGHQVRDGDVLLRADVEECMAMPLVRGEEKPSTRDRTEEAGALQDGEVEGAAAADQVVEAGPARGWEEQPQERAVWSELYLAKQAARP